MYQVSCDWLCLYSDLGNMVMVRGNVPVPLRASFSCSRLDTGKERRLTYEGCTVKPLMHMVYRQWHSRVAELHKSLKPYNLG